MEEGRNQATQPGHCGNVSSKEEEEVDTEERKTDVDDNLPMTRATKVSIKEKEQDLGVDYG